MKSVRSLRRNLDRAERFRHRSCYHAVGTCWPAIPTSLSFSSSRRSTIHPGASKVTGIATIKPCLEKRCDRSSTRLPWFDENSGLAISPPLSSSLVRLFVMGKNEWRAEQEWPLARTQYTPYFLSSMRSANSVTGDGTLNALAPIAKEPADSYQNEVEGRADVLVYTTPSLNQDVEVTGPISLILYVSTTAPNTDFTAKPVDVHHDGSAFNISEGALRLLSPIDTPFPTQAPNLARVFQKTNSFGFCNLLKVDDRN